MNLVLAPPGPLAHWADYELGHHLTGVEDIKFLWEPARFGWAFTLGRAYTASGNEGYAQAFWRNFEVFQQRNPLNLGPHWMSGQEVALRLLAFTFAGSTLATSPHTTPERAARLRAAIAEHARRIPLTLVYSRAQNNNHLLSEAAGLYSAALARPDHPEASHWKRLGWDWFNRALQQQIAPDGTYTQHSTNYHRLMLQLALWVEALGAQSGGLRLPEASRQRLAAATRWLQDRVDPATGQAPNLGANDGALIIPLASAPFSDFRPVLQAAACAFLGQAALPPGPWDEQVAILFPGLTGLPAPEPPATSSLKWRMRAVRFTGRPSHADQLHLDFAWRGQTVALDPGTYRYTAPLPWDNALAGTAVHNTVTIDGQDQMLRAGRFLWLDWAQAEVVEHIAAPDGALQRMAASHNGYRKLGVLHRRTVVQPATDRLEVQDEILPLRTGGQTRLHTARLSWLLPDWAWELHENTLELSSPHGLIRLSVQGATSLTLIRAGECLSGSGPIQPVQGWYSPTYGVKVPALALVAETRGSPPLVMTSAWTFPVENKGS